MLSCDTVAVRGQYTMDGRTILMKNSDRPLGEAQPLLFSPRALHEEGETLNCTSISIPQARKTHAVLGTHPYWIWGFETGVNEFGVAIGNEAEGSRCPAEAR